MTDAEKMIWTTAFAQSCLAGSDARHASCLAYECVADFRRVVSIDTASDKHSLDVVMAKTVNGEVV